MTLATKYTVFAAIATLMNLASQDVSLKIYQSKYDIIVSIIIGTMVGLLVKYILDKKYIFRFKTKNIVHNSQTFILYCAMGLVTTAIFFGVLKLDLNLFFMIR